MSVVFRGISSLASIGSWVQILVYLPLTQDLAGRRAFLALSFILSAYYTISSTTRLIFRNTRLSVLPGLFGVLQSFAVPALFLLCLNIYSMPADGGQPLIATTHDLLYRIPDYWELTLKYASPVFAILEAISTVLVAQTAGHVSTHLIEERSESWSFVFLIAAASVYVISAWNLVEAYAFAAREPINATLIGVSITTVIFLSGIAFALRRGSVVEACLILAYNVLNIYFLSSSDYPSLFGSLSSLHSNNPSLPPVLLESITTLVAVISEKFGQGLDFIAAAVSALPMPVVVGVVYRITVMYAAGMVLLAVKKGRQGYEASRRLREEDPEIRPYTVVIGYSRVIFIAVYTHLLLLDNNTTIFWKWLSVGSTNVLWALEIILSGEGQDNEAVVRGLRLKRD